MKIVLNGDGKEILLHGLYSDEAMTEDIEALINRPNRCYYEKQILKRVLDRCLKSNKRDRVLFWDLLRWMDNMDSGNRSKNELLRTIKAMIQ